VSLAPVYRRLGPGYLRGFGLAIFAVTLPSAVAFVTLAAPFLQASVAEIAGLVAVVWLGLVACAAVTWRRWLPIARRLDDWIRAGRDPDRVAELWRVVVFLDRRLPLASFRDGVFFVGIPSTAYSWAALDLSAGEAASAFAVVFAGGVYFTVFLFFGLQLYLRPILRELAASLSPEFELDRPRTSFSRKLVAALLLIGGATGVDLVWVLSVSEASLADVGVGLAVTAGIIASSTLILTMAFSESLTAPVRDLLAATRRVRAGDLSARVPLTSDDELGVLAGSFNRMTDELMRSRERLVSAREEERRRLRRDLHDELGPSLAGVAMRLEAAGGLIDSDPAAAKAALSELRAELGDAISEIRRVV
jgi:signal transduction histidine kinase